MGQQLVLGRKLPTCTVYLLPLFTCYTSLDLALPYFATPRLATPRYTSIHFFLPCYTSPHLALPCLAYYDDDDDDVHVHVFEYHGVG